MERYSRRQFLQLSSIALLGAQLPIPLFDLPVHHGRALDAAPVYASPDARSRLIRYLWPDSIVPIEPANGDWYQVPDGYAQRVMVQPMMPYKPNISIPPPAIPFWAEVVAPVAPVRQWCAADAPPVTRIGHGGTARVIDSLPGDRAGAIWYGLESEDGGLLGWTQGIFWQPTEYDTFAASQPVLEIDRRTQRLTAYEDAEPILEAPVSAGLEIIPGRYLVTRRQISGRTVQLSERTQTFYGVPWRVCFGDHYELSGAYWHNCFGAPAPGQAVQVTPLLARWLYGWLGERGIIMIG